MSIFLNHRPSWLNPKRLPGFSLLFSVVLSLVFVVSSCSNSTAKKPNTIRVDFAYYNPVSLVLKEKGWLEEEFAPDSIKVEWTQSLGSNKALELLNSRSIDFGFAAEIMGASSGLGFLLVDGQTTGRPTVIIASILLFAILGKLTDILLEAIGRRLLKWQDSYGSQA